MSEGLSYYQHNGPHQSFDNRPLGWTESAIAEADQPLGEVVCQELLGGLLRHCQLVA